MTAPKPVPNEWRAFLGAIQFLTRLPVERRGEEPGAAPSPGLGPSLKFLPLIGALIGALAALALLVANLVFPYFLAVVLALLIEMLITGALHEDAVADFCDAFGGGWTREDVLRILKDSRIGSFGVAGLTGALALRAAGLIALNEPLLAASVLAISGAMGRLMVLVVLALLPPIVDREGLASSAAPSANWTTVALGAVFIAPVLALGLAVDWRSMLVATAACLVFAIWFRRLVARRIGGMTGDCLGFAAYAGIVISTLAFAIRW